MYESLKALDEIRLNFSQQGLFIINLTLAFIMFGVALDIKVDSFKKIINNPKSVVIGVISQFFLLPAVTFLIVWLLKSWITPSVALGMLLVASCPGGNISNFISAFAKGNAALSVSLTAIATLGAIFMTPINFSFWGGLYASTSPLLRPIEIDPLEMFKTVFVLLGIPLIVGLWFSAKFPKITAKIIKPIKNLSILVFMGIVVMAFINNFDYFINYIGYIFILVMIHNAVALTTGYSFASLFNITRKDRRSLSIETGIQNSGLGLVLIFNPNIFPPDLNVGGMAFVAAWWGIWHIVAGLMIAWLWQMKPLPDKEKVGYFRRKRENQTNVNEK